MATSPCEPCVLHPCVCRNIPHSTWQLLAFQTEHLESWGDVLFISVATAHSTVPPESVRNPQQMFVQWLKREGVETSTHLSLHSYPVVLSVLCNPFYLILSRQWHPTPVLLPENPTGGGACWAAVHGVTKSRTRLSDFTFTFHFHALEKEMAAHSSVLAWRIPGTGEPGGLLSWGRTESDTTEAT